MRKYFFPFCNQFWNLMKSCCVIIFSQNCIIFAYNIYKVISKVIRLLFSHFNIYFNFIIFPSWKISSKQTWKWSRAVLDFVQLHCEAVGRIVTGLGPIGSTFKYNDSVKLEAGSEGYEFKIEKGVELGDCQVAPGLKSGRSELRSPVQRALSCLLFR